MQPTVIFKRRVPGLSRARLSGFVVDVCRLIKLSGAVTVLITSDAEMIELNRRFRHKRAPTDVLSFPGPSFTKGFAGDIAVSCDIALRNSKTLEHPVAAEIRILVLHGLLHLAGYDHEADQGEMSELENRLRRKLALPETLIQRARRSAGTKRLRPRT
jgi:probable rRNA maturation factor